MERWKSRGRKSQRRERQKKEDAGARKGRCFVAPEGRKVGLLERRVRSHLARWEMKNCTPLWREAHLQVKMSKAPHALSTTTTTTLHYTTPHYTTPHHATLHPHLHLHLQLQLQLQLQLFLHYTTLGFNYTKLQLQLQLHYTTPDYNCSTPHYKYNYNYNYTRLQLQYTTLHDTSLDYSALQLQPQLLEQLHCTRDR